jgi:pyruvyl transferase EpsO
MIQISSNTISPILSRLKGKLKSILNLFDQNGRIYYIDYPVHTNVGDSLINIGTEQFLLENRISVYQRYSLFNMPKLSELHVDENTTFLCQGGGNFGDLYPEHQFMREALIENFPQARIIFLPQSVHYSSLETQKASLEKIAKYSNYHILLRDSESFNLLQEAGVSESSMMPDMAHQLWGILKPTTSAKNKSSMYFLRRDREATGVPSKLVAKFAGGSVDWENIISPLHIMFVGGMYHLLKNMPHEKLSDVSVSIWYSTRNIMVRDAIKYFSKHERVYTNRLHALILALLLERETFAFDNTYGKLSRYADAWLNAYV